MVEIQAIKLDNIFRKYNTSFEMPSIGKIDRFNEKEEDWSSYVERIEQYFVANDIKNEKKVAVLISAMGPSTYGLLKNLTAPDKPNTKSFDELCTILDSHLSPKPIVIAECFRFYKREQLESEQINEYIAELKKLSSRCNFGGCPEGQVSVWP